MKIKFCILVLFHIVLDAQSQFFYPIRKDAEDFSKRILLVQILEEDPAVIKKLHKHHAPKDEHEAKVNEYKELISRHNEWLKHSVSKYWKANSKIEFKTRKEINEILHDIKILRQYAVLNTGWKNEFHYKGHEGQLIEAYGLVAYVAEATDRQVNDLSRGPDQKADYIFKVLFPTDAIVLSDFIFAVQQFNFHLNVAAVQGPTLERYRTLPFLPPFNKAGYEVITQKTLLIPKESIPEDKQAELTSVYEYPVQLVSNKFYEEAINHQFAKHTYVTLAWSDHQHNFAYFVVNAAEGIILAELGQKPHDLKFENHTLGPNQGKENNQEYKQKMGFSMINIVQLMHFLKPVKK